MSIAEKLTTIAENEQKVFEAGKQAEHEEFWSNVLSNRQWQYKFGGGAWNDLTFRPPFDIVPTGVYGNHMFSLCDIKDLAGILEECGVTLDITPCTTRCDSMFHYATKLTRVPYLDFRQYTGTIAPLTNMFYNCTSLHTIEGLHFKDDGTTKTDHTTFQNCTSLENITIYGVIGSDFDIHYSPLTKESIESVVEALSDTAEGKGVSFNNAAFTAAFPTEDDLVDIYMRKMNWNIVY